VSVATAALLPEGPAAEVAVLDGGDTVVVEHPTGTFEAAVQVAFPDGRDGPPTVTRAGIVRTARKLMDGVVFPRTA
jgi:4-oxalomesaconate tautomerase